MMRRAGVAALLVTLAVSTAYAQPSPGRAAAEPLRDCPECPPLALVPPGAFTLGSSPDAREVDATTGETPPLRVAITQPFYVSAREITVGEFRRFVEETGYDPQLGCRVWLGRQWVQDRDRSWRDPGFAQPPADEEPVVCVNWVDARAYADWLAGRTGRKYRLPSEAEWEYLARGGTAFARYWGDGHSDEHSVVSLACDHANVYDASAVEAHRLPWPNANCSDGAAALAPVARYRPNAFGAYDLIGNAREWVQDCFTASYEGRPPDGRAWTWQGGCALRGVRGGSWASRPLEARAAARGAEPSTLRQSDLGFRVVRDYD